MHRATYRLHRTNDPRMPYLLTLERADAVAIRLLAQDRWPTAGRTLFCVRLPKEMPAELEIGEELESHAASVERLGRRLSLVVDRARHRRSDLLFVTKEASEQIFWRAQGTAHDRRPVAKLTTRGRSNDLVVAIDTRERYPWKLACKMERRALRCGDYALVDGEDIVAVVERKTFENFLHELGSLPAFHQSLLDLAGFEQHALVIEAAYGDLLSPKKLHHYKPAFVAKALAEMQAVHPRLRVVFTENRKLAMEWTLRWFEALWERQQETRGQLALL
jgi:hypothetical protein